MAIDQTDDGKVILSNSTSAVTILLHGATILSWTHKGQELLWLSENAILDGSKAVRGGIPLVFPVFGPAPKGSEFDGLPQHGFARLSEWEFLGQMDETTIQFGLGPENIVDEKLKAAADSWSKDFTIILTVELTDDYLKTGVTVENTEKGESAKPWRFNWLFHSYFRVQDVEAIQVHGLQGSKLVEDKVALAAAEDRAATAAKYPFEATDESITIHSEVDRVYGSANQAISLTTTEGKPLVSIEKENLPDVVVWNPWTEKAEGLKDFTPKAGFKQMVCIELGHVAEFQTLQPGEKWNASQKIFHNLKL
jgi:glucose-6-phosphate 1-epimerase